MRRQTKYTGISHDVYQTVFERDGGRCVYCGAPSPLQCAHYVSRARGGMGVPENLVMLCMRCHQAMDQGGGADIKTEVRDYLTLHYDGWTEDAQKYKKETGRC